ncbi:hypothetical protein [Neolewinella antarctica]|uniref:T9SS C-terminal target domain-containing protein n=1 Tax=Neolewinella antarctica TaxID=442734 RepID=A0ABX0X7W4_9BACT|nr:hypothetical protein [Neolewinella antarctica]NJC25086.1 hypothetical protein [Neolewinella antarctica]
MNSSNLYVRQLFICLLAVAGMVLPVEALAHAGPTKKGPTTPSRSDQQRIEFRNNCDNAIAQIDQEINNVRARLTTGGDVWWDGSNGRYIVPKPPPGVPEVSAIYAGAVWLGGRDPGGGLKVSAQQFGRGGGEFDYYPGPLTDEGTTSRDTCAEWDRFFTVSGESIRAVRAAFTENDGEPLRVEDIPEDILGWPSTGNPYFSRVNGFELPNTRQGLAGFWDEDLDGNYDPTLGDYPIIEIRGCTDAPQFPEEMNFWIYNDAGNIHRESNTTNLIRMEIQVQAFAYTTSDDINNMTFQRYKLINRAQEDILDTYFAMWVDPDLGCPTDDYVGSDTTRSLAYVYNEDELDGASGCVCAEGINTYCDEIPILGVDYFRGPRSPIQTDSGLVEIELGMSSFIYINNAGEGTPAPPTTDPNTAQEYYNYLQGRWLDGTPLCNSGNGYDQTPCEETRYIFPDAPNNPDGFSMSTADLPFGDRRTLQASGPFTLIPGAVNELIIGVVFVANQDYPNPSIRRLQQADDLAQSLFDNCFDICDGPDAPDVDVLELDREIVMLLSNRRASNNFREEYTEAGLGIPRGEDSLYRFEGYRIFQFSGPEVSLAEVDDPNRVREVARFDAVNGVTKLFNWSALNEDDNPFEDPFLTPELQVAGTDNGLRHSVSITQDAFASGGETGLVNHRRYYFTAIAYAYNNYKEYDPLDPINPGQPQQYKSSSLNIGDQLTGRPYYEVIPRPVLDRELMAEYGDGFAITRIAGRGSGGHFLDIDSTTRASIESAFAAGETFDGDIVYQAGAGPIDVFVNNPLRVRDGEYEIKFFDESMNGRSLDADAGWMLRCLDGCATETILSERPISEINEQLISEYGFSVNISDVDEPGENPFDGNGTVGGAISYAEPEGDRWLSFLPDGFDPNVGAATVDGTIYNYVNNGGDDRSERFEPLDPGQEFSDLFPGIYPFRLMDWNDRPGGDPFISPVFVNNTMNSVSELSLQDLNNVDIVFTSDKALWSRCPVIETANRFYAGSRLNDELIAEDLPLMFDTRDAPSVTKEAGPDGLPLVDAAADEELARGMGWFPGYAIDVETGQRLAVFFGENSLYAGQQLTDNPAAGALPENGNDLIFNPSSAVFTPAGRELQLLNFVSGGQHFFYVTNQAYDGGVFLEGRFEPRSRVGSNRKIRALETITWAGFPLLSPTSELLSYAEGIVPNKATIKLRVNSTFDYANDDSAKEDDYPTYQFTVNGAAASNELSDAGINRALDMINIVPNPYYGFSEYEDGPNQVDIKITNLPAKATVSIYSLDGKFIRTYNRDEEPTMLRGAEDRPFGERQISPALAWDLKNFKGIPVASGVYLIHVAAPGLGERTLKFFGIQREFDPSGL